MSPNPESPTAPRIRARFTAPLAVLLFLALGAADAGAATCTYAAPTVTVTLNAGETGTVGTSAGIITLNNVACTGNPTTAAAETINANGTTGNEILVVDLTNGPLGPGLTPEGIGTSEIEVNANLGLSGADRVTITGGSGNDQFVAGSTGINLNGDGDADVSFSGTELLTLTGSDGDDMLSAGGGGGTGSVLSLPTTFNGDNGTDTIKPGQGNDTIASGNGEDTLDASEAPSGVTINLATTAAQSTGGLGTKTISGTENVIGSTAGDALDGDGSANDLIGGSGNDALTGAAGDDMLDGGPGNDTGDYSNTTTAVEVSLLLSTQDTLSQGIDTLGGLENLVGSSGADTLTGDDGVNQLRGLAGNDYLEGRGSNDVIEGGTGTDTVSAINAPGAVVIDLNAGSVSGADGSDTLTAIESALGSRFDDRLVGDDAANTLDGDGGIDIVDYSGASRGVTLNLQSNSVTGPGSTDTLSQIESAIGTPYNDTLTGGTLANAIAGGDGDDILVGAAGDDALNGGPGRDTADYATATAAVDADLAAGLASGGAGNDSLAEIENLTGGSGNDVLMGDDTANTIIGGNGLDRINGSGGDDSLDGGGGLDTLDFSSAIEPISVNLAHLSATGQGTDIVVSFQNVTGSPQADQLTGDEEVNLLDGAGGDDTMRGKAADDTLIGGEGTDTVDYSGFSPVTLNRGVNVDLSSGRAAGEGADDLAQVENVIGSGGDDVLRGDGAANRLVGGSGDDDLSGGDGDDALLGDAGRDRLAGEGGDDELWLGADIDFARAGAGADNLWARDHRRDRLDGGSGEDRAQSDRRGKRPDIVHHVEGDSIRAR